MEFLKLKKKVAEWIKAVMELESTIDVTTSG